MGPASGRGQGPTRLTSLAQFNSCSYKGPPHVDLCAFNTVAFSSCDQTAIAKAVAITHVSAATELLVEAFVCGLYVFFFCFILFCFLVL